MSMQVFPAKRQDENCTGRKVFKLLINKNGEHFVNLCESNNFEARV